MIFGSRFPLWQYLNQPLLDLDNPPVLNPHRYWQLYVVWHLEGCFNNNWVEHCWDIDYYQFLEKSQGFIDRHYLEEGNLAFIKHCWHIKH